MANTIKPATATNVARTPTRSVGNINQEPTISVQTMTAEQRLALMAQLKLAQQADVAPLEDRKRELEAELAELNTLIKTIKPSNDTLAVFRAVRNAVKSGNKSLEDIAAAAGYDAGTVEAMLIKHLNGKGNKTAIFTVNDGEYSLTPKVTKS